jgi:hypothetical protein
VSLAPLNICISEHEFYEPSSLSIYF